MEEPDQNYESKAEDNSQSIFIEYFFQKYGNKVGLLYRQDKAAEKETGREINDLVRLYF